MESIKKYVLGISDSVRFKNAIKDTMMSFKIMKISI